MGGETDFSGGPINWCGIPEGGRGGLYAGLQGPRVPEGWERRGLTGGMEPRKAGYMSNRHEGTLGCAELV